MDTIFQIQNHYENSSPIFLTGDYKDYSALHAAMYCQFIVEDEIDECCVVSIKGIASALIAYYGFKECNPKHEAEVIDMFWDRERMCGKKYYEIMEMGSLKREGLVEFLREFI